MNIKNQKYLKDCLSYNPKTGHFRWNKRPISHFKNKQAWNAWNTKYSLKKAGYLESKDGYWRIRIDNTDYRAHRLAWFYVYGYFPENVIDHKNRNKSDNMIENLRESSQSCNLLNKSMQSNNSSGVVGVYFNKKRNKWYSRIVISKKCIWLGCFECFKDAVMARYNGEKKYNFNKCSTESTAFLYLKENKLI